MNDIYPLQLAQLAKTEGELRALLMMWYDRTAPNGGETYSRIKPIIEEVIKDLHNNCG